MRNIPSVLLLVLLVMAGHSHFHVIALPFQCHPDIFINDPRGNAIINSVHGAMRENSTQLRILTQYVHPEAGFLGITVVVNGRNRSKDVFFELDKECFPGSADWWEVQVTATQLFYFHISNYSKPIIIVRTGGCNRECKVSGFLGPIYSMKILGNGKSKWKRNKPERPCVSMPVGKKDTNPWVTTQHCSAWHPFLYFRITQTTKTLYEKPGPSVHSTTKLAYGGISFIVLVVFMVTWRVLVWRRLRKPATS